MGRGRKKKGRAVSGWVILDKPFEMGSTEAVSRIRRLFNADKGGHAGTLDPLASGLLPIALGDATKTVPYVTDGMKVYRFKVLWGAETTTDDLEGEVTHTSDTRATRAEIEAVLPDFTGLITQVPPRFSAVKIDGERAYDLARKGVDVEVKAREVEIETLEIVAHDDASTTFDCLCGKGTYVRSLARDIGRRLGCLGHVGQLRRLEVFPFAEDDMVTLDALEEARASGDAAVSEWCVANGVTPEQLDADDLPIGVHPPDRFASIDRMLVDPVHALEGLDEVKLRVDEARKVRLGNPVLVGGQGLLPDADEAFATEKGALVAIGEMRDGMFHPKRVFAS